MNLQLALENKILGDRYCLHEVVAQSSYSRVYLATDLALNDRPCAIKQLSPNFCPEKMQTKIESTFLREVAMSKEIAGKHPQLCQFYNHFIESGKKYLAQEWIEGITLKQTLCQHSQLSESTTKNILFNILVVLERIHSLGIVHNDIKPSNIILRQRDRLPVLIDFGIAAKVSNNSRSAIVAGTPGYMSLEQARGESTVNNDFYSLGMTAICLLTGRSPQTIDFNNCRDNFWQQTKTAFEPNLVAIIDRAIALEPTQKFHSAREMLAAFSDSHKISATAVTKRDRFPLTLYLGLNFVLAVFGVWLGIYYFSSQLNSKLPAKTVNLPPTEPSVFSSASPKRKPIVPKTKTNPNPHRNSSPNPIKNVIFVPGTSAEIVRQNLGEPLWRKPGFWANSTAWSYENVITKGIDLGYIFDSQTNQLRQAEIAVPPTTDLNTLESALNSFLASETLPADLQQELHRVYKRQQKTHNFTAGNLQGIIQRNPYDRIYISVWEKGFH